MVEKVSVYIIPMDLEILDILEIWNFQFKEELTKTPKYLRYSFSLIAFLLILNPKEGPAPWLEKDAIYTALNKMKDGKAAGVSGIVAEMLKASGEAGLELFTKLFNIIVKEEKVPSDWEMSVIINCFKGKDDAVEHGNFRGLKLLDRLMKVFERVIEKYIREAVKIDDMQFGFMHGKGTMDAIFITRIMQERFLAKKKDLYFTFVDLEKAFDRVPRQVVT